VDVWVEVSPGDWQLVVDGNELYTITTFDYVGQGGDGYTLLQNNMIDLVNTQVFAAQPLLASLQASLIGPGIDVVVDGRISTTSVSRITCLTEPDYSVANLSQVCNNNGYCYRGFCVCTSPGTSGPLCVEGSSSGSSSSLSTGTEVGIAFAVAVPFLLLLMLAVFFALLAIWLMRKQPTLDDDWSINFDELEEGDLVGSGGYGSVYKGFWKGTEVAIKTIGQQRHLENGFSGSSSSFDALPREVVRGFADEIRMMSRLRHPNVVLFMAACTKPPRLCIVMEFMSLGSLYDLLQNELIPDIPMGLRMRMGFQPAKGMHFLHSSGIVHRDLKSLNLLLDAKWNVKVSDFGLTALKDSVRSKETVLGSVPWMAPELLEDQSGPDFMLCDVYVPTTIHSKCERDSSLAVFFLDMPLESFSGKSSAGDRPTVG